jgi:hypothetical protein
MKTKGHRIKRQRKGMRKNMNNRLRNERDEEKTYKNLNKSE